MRKLISYFRASKEPIKVEPKPYINTICKEVTINQREVIWLLVKDHPEIIGGDCSPTPYEILTDIIRWPHFLVDDNPFKLTGTCHAILFDKQLRQDFYENMVEISFVELIDKICLEVWKLEEEIRMAEYRKNNP